MTTPQDPSFDPQSNPQGFQPPGQGQYDPNQPGLGQYPPPGTPETEPKKSNTSKIIIAAAVVVVLVLGVVLWVVMRQSDPATAKAGDCIKVNKASATDADVDKIDCSSPDAVYKVTASGTDAQCDADEVEYSEMTKKNKTTTKLCLQLNVETGDCVQVKNTTDADAFKKVACADHVGADDVFKVALFDHTTSDESVCPEESVPVESYETHTGVLCVAPNN